MNTKNQTMDEMLKVHRAVSVSFNPTFWVTFCRRLDYCRIYKQPTQASVKRLYRVLNGLTGKGGNYTLFTKFGYRVSIWNQ